MSTSIFNPPKAFSRSLSDTENLIELIDELFGIGAVGSRVYEAEFLGEQVLQQALLFDPFADAEPWDVR
jgi:hypothetical protein